MFEICSIGSECPIFHKIGNAREIEKLKIWDARMYHSWKTPPRQDNIGKKCRVPFELSVSIKNI